MLVVREFPVKLTSAPLSGMAAAFLAMNQVHGEVYNVETDEAEDPEAAQARKDADQGPIYL